MPNHEHSLSPGSPTQVADLSSPRSSGGSSFLRPTVVAEWILGLLAIACLGFVAFAAIDERTFQARQTARLDALVANRIEHAALRTTDPFARGASRPRPLPGEPIGRLEIAAAGVEGIITPGTDDRTLRHAIGWVEGTSLPGEPGNVALAAHRDTFFRGLRRVQLEDVITLRTPEATYRYRIDALRVVSPDAVDVLAARDQPALTLITCYPFDYLGAAPLRYVVHASQIDPAR
jgi:sortase A